MVAFPNLSGALVVVLTVVVVGGGGRGVVVGRGLKLHALADKRNRRKRTPVMVRLDYGSRRSRAPSMATSDPGLL